MAQTDTICALSTPEGQSGIAVIRVSGLECRELAKVFLSETQFRSHLIQYRKFTSVTGEVIDSLNFVYMAAPKTYTGEDSLEIFSHGNPLIVRQILHQLLSIQSVRLAEAGEFTRRAFENGKMDLVQAEAVGQLIHAQSLASLKNAHRVLSGDLSYTLKNLRDRLIETSVHLELDVDFAEEEADPDYASWEDRLTVIHREIQNLAESYAQGRLLDRQPRVALFGAPNAGKSSLINALCRNDRLLVSERPGTTRDYVEIPIKLSQGTVILVDTAGLGQAVDELDSLAQERSRRILESSDFKIYLEDGTLNHEILSNQKFDVKLRTKSDLPAFNSDTESISVSSVTRMGLDELCERIENECFAQFYGESGILISSERQYHSLISAQERLDAALHILKINPAVELIAFEVQETARILRELLGEIHPDDVLNRLFSGFCIGK